MNGIINMLETYETPDFLDLDKLYGFSQTCTSGTVELGKVLPCTVGGKPSDVK